MWQQIIIAVVLNLVSALLTRVSAPTPSAPVAGKLDAPTTEEGAGVKVVFGTILRKDLNVVWSGSQQATPIWKKAKGGKK